MCGCAAHYIGLRLFGMEVVNIVEETALEIIDVYGDDNYIIGVSEDSLKLYEILREKGIKISGFIDYSPRTITLFQTDYPVIIFSDCNKFEINYIFEVFDVNTPIYCLNSVRYMIRVAPFVVEHAYGMRSRPNGIELIDSMVAPSASIFADSSSKIIIEKSIIYPRVEIHVKNNSEVLLKGVVIKENVSINVKQHSKINIMEGTIIEKEVELIASFESEIFIRKNVTLEKHVSINSIYKSAVLLDEYVLLMKYSALNSKCKSTVSIGKNTFLNYYDKFASYDSEILIGEDCMVAPNVNGIVGFHSIKSIDDEEWSKKIEQKKSIIIGNHVWIGMGVILLPGAEIADGSMLGAGTIANHAIPPNVCCAGPKCSIIKYNITWEA